MLGFNYGTRYRYFLDHTCVAGTLTIGFVIRICSFFYLQGLSTYIKMMLSTQVRSSFELFQLSCCSGVFWSELFSQALLSAIGVGEKSATVIGATFQVFSNCWHVMLSFSPAMERPWIILWLLSLVCPMQWFLRDFTGMLGGILFTFYQVLMLCENFDDFIISTIETPFCFLSSIWDLSDFLFSCSSGFQPG